MLGMVLPRLRMERGCFDFSKLGRPASPCRLAHLSPPVANLNRTSSQVTCVRSRMSAHDLMFLVEYP